MRQGAEAEATEMGLKLIAFAGKYDGDNESQVAAIEDLIAAGAKGILITPERHHGRACRPSRRRATPASW